MNYADIVYFDTGNSHGISTTLFVSGCDMRCPKCHNPLAQSYDYGKPFTKKTAKKIIKSLKKPHVNYFVLTGGQPTADKNKEEVLALCKEIKEEVPDIIIILYTGHKVTDIDFRFYKYCTYIIDGEFDIDKVSPILDLRGSTNQYCWEVSNEIFKDSNDEKLYNGAILKLKTDYFKMPVDPFTVDGELSYTIIEKD